MLDVLHPNFRSMIGPKEKLSPKRPVSIMLRLIAERVWAEVTVVTLILVALPAQLITKQDWTRERMLSSIHMSVELRLITSGYEPKVSCYP